MPAAEIVKKSALLARERANKLFWMAEPPNLGSAIQKCQNQYADVVTNCCKAERVFHRP